MRYSILIMIMLVLSCNSHLESYNGFKRGHIYQCKVDLYISGNSSEKLLSEILPVDKNNKEKILPAGDSIVIQEIFNVYPDTAGFTRILGEIISGKFKGTKILVYFDIDSSLFVEMVDKQ